MITFAVRILHYDGRRGFHRFNGLLNRKPALSCAHKQMRCFVKLVFHCKHDEIEQLNIARFDSPAWLLQPFILLGP